MKHELKNCPRCNKNFECKVGDIGNCQCTGTTLSAEEIAFIEEKYNECLCHTCLLELKQRYVFFREKYLLQWK